MIIILAIFLHEHKFKVGGENLEKFKKISKILKF